MLRKQRRIITAITTRGCLTWFLLTAIFAVMGLGYATWQGQLYTRGTVATGNIDVYFSEFELNNEKSSRGNARVIFINEKNVGIEIDNAQPGYSATFEYEITNRGSVPARYSTATVIGSKPGKVNVSNSYTGGILEGNGGSNTGQVVIEVEEGVEDSEHNLYDFFIQLDVQQWNL